MARACFSFMRTINFLLHYQTMGLGKKSHLLNMVATDAQSDLPTFFDVKLLDGVIIVRLLPTTNVTSFDDYADQVFIPYILKQIDIVCDSYISNSIKASAREKHGKGVRRKVAVTTKFQQSAWSFWWFPVINKNCFNFFLIGLLLWIVLKRRSCCYIWYCSHF